MTIDSLKQGFEDMKVININKIKNEELKLKYEENMKL